MTSHRTRFFSHVLLLLPFAACATYTKDDATTTTIAAEVATRTGGAFTPHEAIELALRQNPELLALEARARAAGAATTVPLNGQGQWRSGRDELALMLDPLQLLGLSRRGAAIEAQRAREAEAIANLAVARWRTTAAVVEAFRLDETLSRLDTPDVELDADAFERAGLASPLAADRLRAAAARARTIAAELERDRRSNLAELRRLLGLPATAELRCSPGTAPLLRQPPRTESAALTRPDLALALARFHTADRDFRAAVAAQHPAIVIGPEFGLSSGMVESMAMLDIPLGMHGLAEAQQLQRDATKKDLEAAWLLAVSEAEAADARLLAATSSLRANDLGYAASRRALAAARTAIDVDPEAFDRFAEAASMAVKDAMEHHQAAIDHVRAEVARATALGWPVCQEVQS
jgi:outer membrane protein TolC